MNTSQFPKPHVPPFASRAVPVGAATAQDGTVTAWAVTVNSDVIASGTTETADENLAFLSALEVAYEYAKAHPISLYCGSAEQAKIAGCVTVDNVGVQNCTSSIARTAYAAAAELLPTKPPVVVTKLPAVSTKVTVATDASVGGARREIGAGIAFYTDLGRYRTATIERAMTSTEAELAAINLALANIGRSRPLHVLTDSRDAVRIVQHILRGGLVGDLRLAPALHDEASRVRRNLERRTHAATIEWVKGHNGHRLNEVADRLAVAARRAQQMGQTKEGFSAILGAILDDASEAA